MDAQIADVLAGRREWALVEGDSLAVLPTLPAGCVGAVVTDPPYGIGFKYDCHDDTLNGYGRWLWSVLSGAERCCSAGSPFFVWQAMLNVRHFAEWFPRDFRLFAAAKNFVQMRPVEMQYSWDPVIVWWTEGHRYKTPASHVVNRDFHVANTAAVVSKPQALQRQHPCPRPLDQVSFMIGQWVRPGAVVLDPFAGSGTTGVACLQTGRRFIGIEISSEYAALARRRLEAAERSERDSLFPARQAPAPEPSLFAEEG